MQQAEIEQMEKQERQGGAEQHKRLTSALKKQIEQQKKKFDEVCITNIVLLFLTSKLNFIPIHILLII